MNWKQVKNQDGSEMLFGSSRMSSLEEAHQKAGVAIKIMLSHGNDKHSHMSISSEGLAIALHGVSRDNITEDEWATAKEIDNVLGESS